MLSLIKIFLSAFVHLHIFKLYYRMYFLLLVLKSRMNSNEPLSVFANTSVSYADAGYYNKEIFTRVMFDSCLLNGL